jgi:hypothetical protein
MSALGSVHQWRENCGGGDGWRGGENNGVMASPSAYRLVSAAQQSENACGGWLAAGGMAGGGLEAAGGISQPSA